MGRRRRAEMKRAADNIQRSEVERTFIEVSKQSVGRQRPSSLRASIQNGRDQEEAMAHSHDAARKVDLAEQAKNDVRKILDAVRADKRTSLTARKASWSAMPTHSGAARGSGKSAAKRRRSRRMGIPVVDEDRLARHPAQDRSRRRHRRREDGG